jgi:acyl-CoA thioester hydrolase
MSDGKIYRCPIEVRGYELDSFGHVNHSVYLNYLEHARWKCLEDEGITLERMKEWACWPVIARAEVEYRKPTFLGDALEIETQAVSRGRTHFFVEQRILRAGQLVFRGKVQVAMVNAVGRPMEMPQAYERLWKAP